MKRLNHIAPSDFKITRRNLELPYLSPDSVKISELTVKDQLAFCAKIADVFNYYDAEGKINGSWKDLLITDASVFAALILDKEYSQNFSTFIAAGNAVGQADNKGLKNLFIQQFFLAGFQVVLEINQWLLNTKNDFSRNSINELLSHEIVESGKYLLADFYNTYFRFCEGNESLKNQGLKEFTVLDPIWDFEPFPNLEQSNLLVSNSVDMVISKSRKSGETLFSFQRKLLLEIELIYENSLKSSQKKPHIGLLLSFLELFENQQDLLNKLTEKHLDFYYQSILHFKKQPAVADRTYLSLQLAKGKGSLSIEAGSIFLAKTAVGNTVQFEVVQTSQSNEAKISKYYTLNFNGKDSQNPLGIYQNEIKKYDAENLPSWSMLGDYKEQSSQSVAQGFSLSSSDLFLSEGKRVLKLIFTLSAASNQLLSDGLDKGIGLKTLLEEIVFEVTTSAGWAAIPICEESYKDGLLLLGFQIPISFGSIVAYDVKLHGKGYQTVFPILRASFDVLSYELFSQLDFESLEISTKASEIKDMIIENDQGKLKAGGVFMPFGSVPAKGANFYIGYRELFIKPLKKINISFDWLDLPENSFSDYYLNYTENQSNNPFSNTAFTANFKVLKNGKWSDLSDLNPWSLFTDNANSSELAEKKVVEIPGSDISFDPYVPVFQELAADQATGFIKCELNGPEDGFGNELYPEAISRVTMTNGYKIAKVNFFSGEPTWDKLPNKPFIPQMNSLTLMYESSHVIDAMEASLKDFQWYHFGFDGINAVNASDGTIGFLQRFKNEGYAYLGLASTQPGMEINMLVNIKEAGGDGVYHPFETATIEYLSNYGWESLAIQKDDTNGLQASGIITWAMPADCNQLSELGVDLAWVRISKANNNLPQIDFIGLNGLVVEQVLENGNITQIPAFSINKMLDPNEIVKSILQPTASFGGKPLVSDSDFNLETAFRIANKSRMNQFSDYGQILLLNFPELYAISLVPMSYYQKKANGLLKLIVLSTKQKNSQKPFLPETRPETLRSIAQFLEENNDQINQIELSNADYKYLQIDCQFTVEDENKVLGFIDQLNLELKLYLSPWISNNSLAVNTVVSQEKIYAFIQSRPYVVQVLSLSIALKNKDIKDYVIKMGTRIGEEPQFTIKPWEQIVSSQYHRLSVVSQQGIISNSKPPLVGELIISN